MEMSECCIPFADCMRNAIVRAYHLSRCPATGYVGVTHMLHTNRCTVPPPDTLFSKHANIVLQSHEVSAVCVVVLIYIKRKK